MAREDSPLPHSLAFNWGKWDRSGMALHEVRGLEGPRADVRRLLRVADASNDKGAAAFSCYGVFYVVHAGLPCDRTSVASLREVAYVDLAMDLLAGLVGGEDAAPLQALQDLADRGPSNWQRLVKTTDSLRCVFRRWITEHDWGICRRDCTDLYRVSAGSLFRRGVALEDSPTVGFEELPQHPHIFKVWGCHAG